MTRRILFLIAHPPYRGALAFEMLDELLVGAVFDQKITVLFIDDGVYQLLDGADVQSNVARGYRALPTYDVTDVYVDKFALKRRGLHPAALAIPARPLTRRRIQTLLASHDVIIPD